MQNEKNTRQDEVNFTEAELRFARSLEETLNHALGDDDKVTPIWSRLKPDQRARVAEDYLSKLQHLKAQPDPDIEDLLAAPAHDVPQPPEAPKYSDAPKTAKTADAAPDFEASLNAPAQPTAAPHSASPQAHRGPPPGYPADFNPLAGFPGLEPSRGGPRPEDIIASALPGYQDGSQVSPLDALRGLLPGGLGYGDVAATPTPQPTQPPQPNNRAPWPSQPTTPNLDPDGGRDAFSDFADELGAELAADLAVELGPAAPNFWPLWIEQQDVLLKQCLKLMSGNMDDAQDALSEAMVKASTKFEASMDEIRNHRAWLSRIVHNACIDLHRQNRRKAEYKEETHGATEAPASPISPPVVPSPEESFLTNEKLDQLDTVLGDLPEKLRKPLLMRCVQDRSYDDIAKALGLSNCAVRKRVQLARDHLKDADIQ
ncbi:sigma-70 family RNA polymerase sigma factor [Thalassospira lucentensis]|uniref:sigma-70 family RNA polymerase sigma factor n=1 Tax=Thalassospira lucentensis TaxID=168935 RepID=UPI003AA80DF0